MKTTTFKSIRLQPALNRTFALSGLLLMLAAAPAFADEVAEVTRLTRAGQYAEALTRADTFLGKNPRDAQMRFLKGVILTEQNKSSEAIVIFTKMTEDFPTLPEPYNNLAVLYAANGQYDKARTALDAAIRTNPAYATAYENLGDVHAKLASQAYDKALQLDSGNSTAKSKLTLVRSLVGNMQTGTKTAAAPAPAAPAKPAPEPPPKVAAATPAPTPAVAPKAAAPAKPAPAPVPPVAAAKPEPAKPQPKPDHTKAEKEDVMEVVNGWAHAWSSRDVKTYLNYYSNDFQTPNGQKRKAWEDERHARIVGKGRINVKVEAPQVTINGNAATVKFRQSYASDRLTVNARKTLELVKRNGKWLITQEKTGG